VGIRDERSDHRRKERIMAKIPPAMWENPAAFVPDEVNETEGDPTETPEPADPDDGTFKRIAEEDDEAVEDPGEPAK
jgi:hypothetical protein